MKFSRLALASAFCLSLFSVSFAASSAFADGEDDNCSAAEGWPKPAHCGSSRQPSQPQPQPTAPARRPLLSKILCGAEASDTATAAANLNALIAIGNINEPRRRFYFSEVSQPAFNTVGSTVTACVTVRGAYIEKIPGER
jgi:hypothetical protein